MTAADEYDIRDALLGRFASLIRVPARQTPDQWAAENRVYGPETGVPGPRDPHLSPSLVPLGRAAVSGLYSRVVGVTGSQMGKTDSILDIMGQRLSQRPAPLLYVGPSRDFNTDQFEPRLKQLIDESEDLKSKLIRGRREKKLLKIVAGVRVRLASGGSSTALKSDPAGMGFVDEYDGMGGGIRGQGTVLGMVESRGITYADFVLVVTSTPNKGGVVEVELDKINGLEFFAVGEPTEIESPTWRVFQDGTRHHWAWHCPHCGGPFIPMRKHLEWTPGATPAQAARSAYLVCPRAGCIIEDDADGNVKAAMNAGGFMIAPGHVFAMVERLGIAFRIVGNPRGGYRSRRNDRR
jgi:phage terminase large subunit GpA-like protein